jgi:molybdate transport system substrate-binding protein
MSRRTFPALLSACVLAAAPGASGEAGTKLRIAAAANLAGVAERLAAACAAAEPDLSVEFVFGATGALVAQIRAGAPFGLLLAADTAGPERLAAEGLADGAPAVYAYGALAVVSRLGVDPAGRLGFLAGGAYRSVALANPELAPYGAAAVAALRAEGVWDSVGPRAVYGASVAQAALFVASGAADAGLVNLSAVLGDAALAALPWARVDPALYPPLAQGAAVVAAASAAERAGARRFLAFLGGPAGRKILAAAGYSLPGAAGGGP